MPTEPRIRKESAENTDPAKDALFVIRLELMRLPNIKKLKPERLTALSTNILARLQAKGYLAIDLGDLKTDDDGEEAPEQKLNTPQARPTDG